MVNSGNNLPSSEDAYRLASRIMDYHGNSQFFLFPLGWGGARIADLIEQVNGEYGIGLNFKRYDLPVNDFSSGEYRAVSGLGCKGDMVRRNLEHGQTQINSIYGRSFRRVEPVDFVIKRSAVILDDWVGYTGQAMKGGIIWAIDNRGELNLDQVIPAAMEGFAELKLPTAYTEHASLVSPLVLPYEELPLIAMR